MNEYIKNDVTNVTCYKVNENTPFKIEWLVNILENNLPPYYNIVTIGVEYNDIITRTDINIIMEKLAQCYTLAIFNRYVNEKIAEFKIITIQKLTQIQKNLYKIKKEVKNVKYFHG